MTASCCTAWATPAADSALWLVAWARSRVRSPSGSCSLTTSAGRFVATQDRNLQGKEILWVDYDAAISLHPVITSNATERRAQRLDSSSPQDNRISYGCINVPAEFFDAHLLPVFSAQAAAIYVLPDQLTLEQVFGSLP